MRETKVCIYRLCLLDMGTAKAPHLSQSWLSTNRSGPNILTQLYAEKQWGGGGGVYYSTLAPYYQL